MKKNKTLPMLILLAFSCLIISYLYKENNNAYFSPKELWMKDLNNKKEKKNKGFGKTDNPDQFTEYFNAITKPIGFESSGYEMNYKTTQFKKAINEIQLKSKQKTKLSWISRGPSNVGGRTRAIVVDPEDDTKSTWIAGAASGGIWITTDKGDVWKEVSTMLSNLSVNALAISESNPRVLYAGTGESFPGGARIAGNGIWKSIDKGENWEQLNSTVNNQFSFVNRIIINPANENNVIAATENGLFISQNGGESWDCTYISKYGIEDLVCDPIDFNIIYATEHSVGVLKSINSGNTWKMSNTGLGTGSRFEITVSKVDNNILFLSANVSNLISNVYISENKGEIWKKFNDNQAFLSTQGDYDNTIEAHPYNAKEVFVGGVDIWKVAFSGDTEESKPTITNVFEQNTSYLEFVDFGGTFLGGGLDTGQYINRTKDDWSAVEIRFGAGISQKAHLFQVPDKSTSGVSAEDYSYIDYVEVPFQVWDVTNNRQLMVSVRDQEKDGSYNLYSRLGEAYGLLGREYIFVNAILYDEHNPSDDITTNGGHLNKCLFMCWPILAEGYSWVPDNLPESKIVLDYNTFTLFNGNKTIVADSYKNYDGPNNYDQSGGYGSIAIPGLHPDHHNLIIIPKDNGRFDIINTNDGGIALSEDNGNTFNMAINGYVTTQFYGVAKNHEKDEYIGGMQDNGTWQSFRIKEEPSEFSFRVGGDGFECLWHRSNSNLILASIYNNSILKSLNKGASWEYSYSGIEEDDGPFITKLSASKEEPDIVFAVGNSGVYRSKNFGTSWEKIQITPKWSSGEVTSAHNVEVSLANGNIVWAGGAMAPKNKMSIHVSVNEGLTFNAVNNFTDVEMEAYISGITTHPMLDSTAYILFSLQGKPKVIRTADLGNSWEDISGFGTSTASSNGFPDVVVHSLIVMPHNPEVIWVGTDIGLFESINNGESWHIANNGLPPVSVYDMQIVGHQVVVATHGRGIWTVDIPEIDNSPYIDDFTHVQGFKLNINTNIKVAYDSVQVLIDGKYHSSVKNPAVGVTDIPVEVADNGKYLAQIVAYIGEQPYKSNKIDVTFDVTSFDELGNKISTKLANIYPNPCNGKFSVNMTQEVEGKAFVQVYGLNGALIHIQEINSGNTNVKLEGVNKGTYIVKIHSKSINETHKLIIK